jgi:signal transduction histidine kinase
MDLRQDLHDLSQPLTRLQWRLELAKLTGDDAELRETIAAALVDVGELIERVRQIRSRDDAQQERAQQETAQQETAQQEITRQETAGRAA